MTHQNVYLDSAIAAIELTEVCVSHYNMTAFRDNEPSCKTVTHVDKNARDYRIFQLNPGRSHSFSMFMTSNTDSRHPDPKSSSKFAVESCPLIIFQKNFLSLHSPFNFKPRVCHAHAHNAKNAMPQDDTTKT